MLCLKKFDYSRMDFKLEPVSSEEEKEESKQSNLTRVKKTMKITEEKKADFYLADNGFSEKEINFIRKQFREEGLNYCVRAIISEDIMELKNDLREHMKQLEITRIQNLFNHAYDMVTSNRFMF